MADSDKRYSRSEFLSFFRDKIKPREVLIRPPYAVDESRFSDICPDCSGRCVPVCPQQIIVRRQGVPRLDFSSSGCTFCLVCAESCELGVLQMGQPARIIADIHLDFSRCLAWQGTICQSCKDACPEEAIVFDGMKNPNIRKDVCTRCGLCLSVCPVSCIKISGVRHDE